MTKISNQHEDSPLQVTSSIDQAAKEIMLKSFCIFQTSAVVRNQISSSRLEALKILDQQESTSSSAFESLYRSCHRVVNGNLYGFHLPSPAKRLFRAFPYSDCQPWPNHQFRSSSRALTASLHDILVAILEKLKEMPQSNGNQRMETRQTSVLSDSGTTQPSRKRKRRSDESSSSSSQQPSPAVDSPPQAENDWDIPATAAQTTKCPLDYFFYHNNDPQQINCSEHVDRGALICVCLSSASPGLEVLLPGGKQHSTIICPEASLIYNKSLYGERNADSGLICIMAGDQLGALIGMERQMACVHRVRNNLTRARLSISYELRL